MQIQRQQTLWRVLGAAGLALPTLYWSPMWGAWLHFTAFSFPLAIFVPAVFGTAAVVLLGRSRALAAIEEIKSGQPAQSSLAVLGLAAAWVFSLVLLIAQATHSGFAGTDFWWQLALLLVALEIGDSITAFALKRVHLGFANQFAQTGNEESQEFESNELSRATKQVMFWVAISVAAIAAVTATAWAFGANAQPAVIIERAISVLAVASPLAVNIIAPLVQTVAIAQAKRDQALVLNIAAFEAAYAVDLVLFDKTGVLTTGVRSVESIRITRRGGLEDEAELLAVLAGLEVESEHSLAQAVATAARQREIDPAEIKDIMNIPGIGVSGRIGEYRMLAGGPGLLTRQKIDIDVQDLYDADAMNTAGQTVIYVARDNILLGMVGIGDETRKESADAIWEIHALRQKAGLLTGDAQGVAKSLASELEMDETYAEVLPHDKASVVEKLQASGRVVAFVGDAITDAAAIGQANLGLAFSAEATGGYNADIAILSTDPEVVSKVLALSKRARAKHLQSLWIAGGFNLAAVLLAAGVIQPLHLVFVPGFSALFSALATAIVVNGIGALWSKR